VVGGGKRQEDTGGFNVTVKAEDLVGQVIWAHLVAEIHTKSGLSVAEEELMRTTSELQKQAVKLDKELQSLSSTYIRGDGIVRSACDNLVRIGSFTMS
jgi:hypothetical protein